MISHVQEFICQYTNQVKKKHKVWQDGRLKFFVASKRFMLYNEDGDTLLSSNFITNEKELNNILDRLSFGTAEHKIFARYVVIIQELVAEYDRDTRLHKMRETTKSANALHRPTKRRKLISSSSDEGGGAGEIVKVDGGDTKKTSSTVRTTGSHSLALKFDVPFKPPRVRLRPKDFTDSDRNRPVARRSKVQIQGNPKNSGTNAQPIQSTSRLTERKSVVFSLGKVTKESSKEKDVVVPTTDTMINSTQYRNHVRVCLANNLRVKRIIHEPIVLD